MAEELWSEVIMRTGLAIEKRQEQAKERKMMQDETIKEQKETIRSSRRVVENFIKALFVSMLAEAGLVVSPSGIIARDADGGENSVEKGSLEED
eukprot:5413865-Karenia_brevis.AAC.1